MRFKFKLITGDRGHQRKDSPFRGEKIFENEFNADNPDEWALFLEDAENLGARGARKGAKRYLLKKSDWGAILGE
jgi:hypothetical protein